MNKELGNDQKKLKLVMLMFRNYRYVSPDCKKKTS